MYIENEYLVMYEGEKDKVVERLQELGFEIKHQYKHIPALCIRTTEESLEQMLDVDGVIEVQKSKRIDHHCQHKQQ